MIIDAHQHYWNMDKLYYSWLNPDAGVLYNNYEPKDLEPQVKKNGVEKTVVVQALSDMKETEWLLSMAQENDFIGAVVAWVDLKADNIDDILDELCKNPKFKGVRHQVEDEPNREWILDEKVLRGLKSVAKHGLTFDALLKQDQLWQLDKVMECCSGLRVVIDHCAKPDIKNGKFEPWASYLAQAAKLPVMCKLSGLITEADRENWKISDIRPYSDYVIEIFGAERVMVGSDWPVSRLAAEYGTTMETTWKLIAHLSDEEQRAILYENAKRFYGL